MSKTKTLVGQIVELRNPIDNRAFYGVIRRSLARGKIFTIELGMLIEGLPVFVDLRRDAFRPC
jgi:hypothetical protein